MQGSASRADMAVEKKRRVVQGKAGSGAFLLVRRPVSRAQKKKQIKFQAIVQLYEISWELD